MKKIKNIKHITNDMHIGFINSPLIKATENKGYKGYIVFTGSKGTDDIYNAIRLLSPCIKIDVPNASMGKYDSNIHKSQKDVMTYLQEKFTITEIYSFKTVKKLHKWLSK